MDVPFTLSYSRCFHRECSAVFTDTEINISVFCHDRGIDRMLSSAPRKDTEWNETIQI